MNCFVRKIKKLICLIAVAAIGFSSLSAGQVLAVNGSDPSYFTVDSSGTITNYTGPGGDVVIPSVVGGVTVTSIGGDAFVVTDVTSVVIPEGVTSIGSSAFEDCQKLTSVIFPSTLVSIGPEVFDTCSALKSVIIPKSVTNIGDLAFTQILYVYSGSYALEYAQENDLSYVILDPPISVTCSTTANYTIDPSAANPMSAQDVSITNNSSVPVKVTLQSLSSTLSGTNGFRLSVKIRETATGSGGWSQISTGTAQYAGGASVDLGVLSPGGTGHIQLVADLPSLRWPMLETDEGSATLQFTASN